MSELFDTLRSHTSNDAHMRDLGRHSQLETLEKAQAAYDVALRAVEAVLSECAESPESVEQLLGVATAFKWADRDDPTRLFSGEEELIGEQITEIVFGDNLPIVEGYLTNETNISSESAIDVLQVVSAVSLASAVGAPGQEANLVARIGSDGSIAPVPVAEAPETPKVSEAPEALGTPEKSAPDPEPKTDVSDKRSYRGAAKIAAVDNDEDVLEELHASGSVPADNELEQRQKRIAIGTAAAVVVAGLFFVISNGSDNEPTETLAATEDSADDTSSIDDPDETAQIAPDLDTAESEDVSENAVDVESDDETSVDETSVDEDPADADQGPIITYNVPMVDIVDPDRDAEGLLGFDFNTETGEVCYRVVSSNINGPYRTHIHVGGSGEKGGIVVDMGPQESGATGCLENPPADINNILADLENHYAELHDISEEWTIRGQLAEAFELTGVAAEELEFDPSEDGAYLAIEDGIAVLRGEVPDLLTVTSLQAIYAPGGSGLVVTNELTVNSEAPIPSGRIVLVDHEFPVSLSEMPEIDAATEETLAAILSAQEGWKLTAVGRTDSDGSELNNLELSLRRAKSLREYLEGIGAFDGSVLVRGAGDLGFQGRFLELEFVPQQ
jgi:flagellar motor protein MotB